MEERKFTEKESLELISQMISASRQRLQKGSGNPFLYYGYTSIAISAATFLLARFSGSWAWNLLWMLMFIPAIVLWVKDRDSKPEVTSYIDRMLSNTWKVVLMLMVLSLAVILGSGFGSGTINLMLMLPLALIFVCTGTLITGLTIGEGSIVGMTTIAFVMPVLLLSGMVSGEGYLPVWNLAGGFSFLFSLVIPGHIINHKISRSC
ncbi:MAG TPA: hypothetical protein IAC98_03785 [Candidatus Cryptobacteroides pullicola]|nr:hypothetical protein [Candidatus Cryptobacteroides pullicola]